MLARSTIRRSLRALLVLPAVPLLIAGCSGDDGSSESNEPVHGGEAGAAGDASNAGAGGSGESEHASAGCNQAALEAGDHASTLQFAGMERPYTLHVPAGYDASTPTPLVINLHGFLSNYMEQPGLTGMSELADREGFMVVYPNGAGEPVAWNGGDCCAFGATDQDDVAFISALLDAIGEQTCVDTARVYATGYSNGGFLSHRLACELSDRVAAVATVAGVLGVPDEACQPDRDVPVFMIHGDADMTVPYAGGSPGGFELLYPDQDPPVFRSAAATAEFWRTHDGCDATTTTSFMMGDATCESYAGCDEGSQVTLCTIAGGGHTWPGGDPMAFQGVVAGLMISTLVGVTSTSMNASEQIWDFFSAHPLE
jgi:polyhydroxybutyrate depolymerase